MVEQESKEPLHEKFIKCPFCKEGDFDLPGLKYHLINNYCADFNNANYKDYNGQAT